MQDRYEPAPVLSSNSKGEAVEFLFDSKGHHIANFVNGQLHAPTGQNIGHFMKDSQIFIDMQGRYLGEIVLKNRLMFRRGSPNQSVSYGS